MEVLLPKPKMKVWWGVGDLIKVNRTGCIYLVLDSDNGYTLANLKGSSPIQFFDSYAELMTALSNESITVYTKSDYQLQIVEKKDR